MDKYNINKEFGNVSGNEVKSLYLQYNICRELGNVSGNEVSLLL